MNLGKQNVLGVLVDAVDYNAAVDTIVAAGRDHHPLAVSALAVHGVMTGLFDLEHRHRLNSLDLAVPDGQPVRWALNLLYGAGLAEPVRGTDLTLRVLSAAATAAVPVFFYGSRPETLDLLRSKVRERFPQLVVAGTEPSKFRALSAREQEEIAGRIEASGARIVFVGLGCPRQETFVYELRTRLSMPLIAVGAAFDYLAGLLPEPPMTLRRLGLEWLWRLAHEPRRLWRRYLLLNPAYLVALGLQASGLWRPSVAERATSLKELDA